MPFKKDFVWGTASASYQIEGAVAEDGRGQSVWDMFCRRPGAVYDGHTGEIACDHYHRWGQDVELMKGLGLRGYRFSLAWPRIIPQGAGKVNPKGLDFYNRLIDSLLAANIQPWVTLFHWDYPYDLFCRGGWLNPDSPEWFADYAQVVAKTFGDRVRHWMTLNEIQCFIGKGHLLGDHAPGLVLPTREFLQAGHNAMLAHGRAVQVLRADAKLPSKIGFAPASQARIPFSDSPRDIGATRQVAMSVLDKGCWNNAWWMDPIFLGHYPEDGLKLYGADAPAVKPGDMETISQPVDFCGANIYFADVVRAGPDGRPQTIPRPPGYDYTSQTDWPVSPASLYWGPKFFYERYKKPIVITENGCQNLDLVSLDGKVHDPQRINYLQRYLLELERAVDDGIPVDGYFTWTLTDNFEWALGYKIRVGLVYTNYRTLERIPKDSYYWYRKVIASNGRYLHEKA